MGGRPKRRTPPDPREVLAGRTRARIDELFELIHRVNPTGRGLSDSARAEAYALKAGLQSLLIETFGDALEVEESADEEQGTISIRHRHNRRDACHALVGQLSPAARAWVRLQRDLREDVAAEEPHPKASRGDPHEPPLDVGEDSAMANLRRGEAALEEYDFEGARSLLARALQQANARNDEGERMLAARALLGLLVDQLGDDEGALALREQLSPPTLEDDEIRGLIALAAARRDQPVVAEKLLAGVDGERADEVLVALARSALGRGDTAECERLLARVPEASAHRAVVLDLMRTVDRRRAETAQPLEQRLADLIAQGDWDQAQPLAQHVIALHPHSEVARRALHYLAARSREVEVRVVVARIDDALAARDPALAAALLRTLDANGVRLPDVEERVQRAARGAAMDALSEEVARLSESLGGELTADTVRDYWSARQDVRSAARAQVDRVEVAWLDELGPTTAGGRSAAAAAAATALARVEEALARGDIDTAARILSPHEGLASASARGRKLLARVRADLAARRRQQALGQLTEAEAEAEADGDLQRTHTVLGAIARSDLRDEDRRRLETLEQRISAAEHSQRLRRRLEELEAAGEWLEARDLAAQLAKLVPPADRPTWRAHAARLGERVRSQWLEEEASGAELVAELRGNPAPRTTTRTLAWLLPGGKGIVLANARGSRVFVRVLDLESPQQSRAAVFLAPEPLRLLDVAIEGNRAWLCGDQHALEVQLDPWDVLCWKGLAGIPGGFGSPLTSMHPPASRYLWVGHATSAGGLQVRVVDPLSWATARDLGEIHGVSPLRGGDASRLMLSLSSKGRECSWRAKNLRRIAEAWIAAPCGRRGWRRWRWCREG